MKRRGPDSTLSCSFCHKSQDVVGKLISSPSDHPRAYICDECIAVCNSILEDDKPQPASAVPASVADPESQSLREALHVLLDDLPETELATIRRILIAFA